MMIIERLKESRIIPVISVNAAKDIVPLCQALKEGGLTAAEITFGTPAARDAIRIVGMEFPEFLVGAGSVTTVEDAEAAKDAGAQFAAAPGFNRAIVEKARDLFLPFFPGVATPTDVETALDCGCQILKFFPAEALGGLSMLKSIFAPYKHRGIQFIPTGGINEDNANDYLAFEGVIAVGGSWIVASSLIRDKRWDEITRLTAEALQG
jgi:2-dehydro-3-deoxyphosphogluconate aldolase/(4S)-4-hydroxy-2-oxoglutarate aldolase